VTIPDWLISVLSSEAFTSILLTAFAGVVTAIVSWIAVVIRQRILHDLSATDLALLRSIAGIAVQWAEQTLADADNAAKLAAAIKAANTMLAGYGLRVTIEQLTAIVEAAVYAETAHATMPTGS
jgi:hypothetical protein